jgi:hypothetical protein
MMNKGDNDKKDKATAKNCSIKRECLDKTKQKFLTKTPHTANMLFSWKIDQKKGDEEEKEFFLCIHKKQKEKDFYQYVRWLI